MPITPLKQQLLQELTAHFSCKACSFLEGKAKWLFISGCREVKKCLIIGTSSNFGADYATEKTLQLQGLLIPRGTGKMAVFSGCPSLTIGTSSNFGADYTTEKTLVARAHSAQQLQGLLIPRGTGKTAIL
jgi:hypothetical protein